MATVETRDARNMPFTQDTETSAEIAAGESAIESIGGVAAVIFAILGLCSILPVYMLPIAILCASGALLFEGGALAGRYRRLLAEIAGKSTRSGSGAGVEVLGGVAGIVLGILALAQIHPLVLSAVAAIVLGSTLLLSSAAAARLSSLEGTLHGWSTTAQEVAREATQAASAIQVLAGIGIIVLGILALTDVHPAILCLVAFLAAGGAILFSGAALGGRFLSFLSR